MISSVLGVIPARLSSHRLPRKPLHLILGRPLLEWVWLRVSAMSLFDRLVVATDDDEVRSLCDEMGAAVVMTDADHRSGTDRIGQVAAMPEFAGYAVVVNVQGDEPLVAEAHLVGAVEMVRAGAWDLATCASPLRSLEAWTNPSVVKVARGSDGRALYFSRSPIPFLRDGEPSTEALAAAPFLRHVGVYVYSRDALARWVAMEPSPLERLEKLEQLRPLEAGMRIGVTLVDDAAPGVDTRADALAIERLLTTIETLPA